MDDPAAEHLRERPRGPGSDAQEALRGHGGAEQSVEGGPGEVLQHQRRPPLEAVQRQHLHHRRGVQSGDDLLLVLQTADLGGGGARGHHLEHDRPALGVERAEHHAPAGPVEGRDDAVARRQGRHGSPPLSMLLARDRVNRRMTQSPNGRMRAGDVFQ